MIRTPPGGPLPGPQEIGGLAKQIAERLKDEVESQASDSTIIGELEKQRKEGKTAANDRHRLMRENIAFYEGLQHLESFLHGMLNTAGLPRGRRQLVTDNVIGDHSRRLYARMQQVRYAPSATADTDVPDDRKAAKALHGVLRWFYRRKKVKEAKRKTDMWLVVTGQCYLEAYFDPQGGPEMLLPVLDKDGQPIMEPALDDDGEQIVDMADAPADPVTNMPPIGADGQPLKIPQPRMRPTMELQRVGDADYVVRSDFDVVRDPRFQDWKRLRWLFVEESAARDDIVDRYGGAFEEKDIDLERKLPQGGKTNPIPWIPDVAPGTTDFMGLPKPAPAQEGVLTLIRYYERPCRKYPKGRHLVYVEGMADLILHKGDLPRGDFPVRPLVYNERPWVLDGKSPISETKALQRLHNRIYARWGDHLVRMPAGWLLIPTNSGIPKNAFTSEIGSVIRHTPGSGVPAFVFPPWQGLQWYERFLLRIEASFEERFFQPPATRGIMPRGAKAARTVQLLQEAADEVHTPVLDSLGDQWAGFYELIADIIRENYTVARMMAIEGHDKRAEILSFKGDMIPGDWRDRISINVEMGESLPRSQTARQEVILSLAKEHGFFGEPGTPEYVRKLRGALDLDAGFVQTEEDLDAMIAEDENLQMLHERDAVSTRRIDDDWVHLVEHLTFAKSLIARGEEGAAIPIVAHADLHWMQYTQKQAGGQNAEAQGARLRKSMGTPPVPSNAGAGTEIIRPEQTPVLPGQEPQDAGPPGPPPEPAAAPAAQTAQGVQT